MERLQCGQAIRDTTGGTDCGVATGAGATGSGTTAAGGIEIGAASGCVNPRDTGF